jgi:DNA-binding transcriptional LysR family regulator
VDLTDLKTFLSVAETGSFSVTAKQLHVTQPAVSKRLANLENHLGIALIERLPRDARLTFAGKLLKTRGELILREIDNTQSAIQNLSKTVIGPLSIATSHHIGLHHLPAEIRKYLKDHPQVELDLHFLASEAIETALLSGEAELALLTLPLAENPLLCYQPLWHDPLYFVVGKDHPLAINGSSDDKVTSDTGNKKLLVQLTKYRAFLPGTESVTFQLISRLFSANKLSLQPTVPTNYLETIKMMVSVGLGWGVLPVTMLDDSLVKLPTAAELSRELGVVYDMRRNLSNPARAMLAQLSGG